MKKMLLATCIVANVLTSCSKDDDTETQPSFKVYAAFNESATAQGYDYVGKTWKDGTVGNLISGFSVSGFFVDGNDVYAS